MEPFDLRKWKGFAEAGGSRTKPALIDHASLDSRRIYSRHTLFVALPGTRQDGHDFVLQAAQSGAEYALVRRDYRPPASLPSNVTLLRVTDPLTALQEIAGTYRAQYRCMVVGIAGSYGKTMVKDCLQAILQQSFKVVGSPESFNSQIGVPFSLFKIAAKHQIALVEAAISKPGEMSKLCAMIAPDHAIFTQLGKKHLEGFGSADAMAKEMALMLRARKGKGWSLLPDDPILQSHYPATDSSTHFWNVSQPHLPHASKRVLGNGTQAYELLFPDSALFTRPITDGHHYFIDLINIAAKAAWLLGASQETIIKTLHTYTPEPMRKEMWHNPSGGLIINEPYAADPQSVDLALRHFENADPKGKKYFIFGGLKKTEADLGKEYERIGQAILKAKPDQIFLVHEPGSPPFPDPEIGTNPRFASYSQAFECLKTEIKPRDTILIKGARKQPLDEITKALQGSVGTNQCFINLAAIATNLKYLRTKAPSTRIMPIIKASAYGTDATILSKFFQSLGVDILGVSYVDEGAFLKDVGVRQSIFTMNAGLHEAEKAVELELEVGLSDLSLAHALAEASRKSGKITKVHLHVDTGMSRLGCRKEEAVALAQHITDCPYLKLEGIMTHFACAENPNEDSFTQMQVRQFDHLIEQLSSKGIPIPWKHAANSSGLLRFHLPQYNMARIGLALYGLSSGKKPDHSLKLALSLQSRIVGINHCKKGETVSYGRNYTIQKDQQRIAVVPIGYYDGLHRHFSGKGNVMIHGLPAPMVGSICMDYLMVDITHIPQAALGDPVLIFGEDPYGNSLSPEELAGQGESIVHELISCLGPRIQRVFIHDENPQSC